MSYYYRRDIRNNLTTRCFQYRRPWSLELGVSNFKIRRLPNRMVMTTFENACFDDTAIWQAPEFRAAHPYLHLPLTSTVHDTRDTADVPLRLVTQGKFNVDDPAEQTGRLHCIWNHKREPR